MLFRNNARLMEALLFRGRTCIRQSAGVVCIIASILLACPVWKPITTVIAAGFSEARTTNVSVQPQRVAGNSPIESIRVGQRVLVDAPEAAIFADGRTPAGDASASWDDRLWRTVTMHGVRRWVDGTIDTVNVRSLMLAEHLTATGTTVGSSILAPIDVIEMGFEPSFRVTVDRIDPAPRIAEGLGRVVMTTIDHLSNSVMELRVQDSLGQISTIYPTAHHKFFSVDQDAWVSTEDLPAGSKLHGRNGLVEVVRLRKIPAVQRVYNLTVEGEHYYRVADHGVLVHNMDCAPKSGDGFLQHGTKSDQTVTTNGLDLDEIKAREGHDPTGFSLTPYDDIADGFANNPLRPGEPLVIGIRPSTLENRGIKPVTGIGLTEAGEIKILPKDFGKIQPGDFEVLR